MERNLSFNDPIELVKVTAVPSSGPLDCLSGLWQLVEEVVHGAEDLGFVGMEDVVSGGIRQIRAIPWWWAAGLDDGADRYGSVGHSSQASTRR
jgi:hypothetical protein